jgi:hypothetical protein
MAKLDVIVLSDDLRIRGLKNLPVRAGSVRYLLDGGYVDQSMLLVGGTLILEAFSEGDGVCGYFTGAQVDAIRDLRLARTKVLFVHHTGQWQVKVLEIEVEPVQGRADPNGNSIYIGTITLLIV